jgi:hypothetical protein
MNRRPSDIDARLVAWLEEGPTSGPEEVLSRTFARARSTRQDRVWLDRLTKPTRFHAMNSMLKVAAVAAFVLAVSVTILPRGPDIGAAPAPSPSPSPSAVPFPYPGALAPGTYSGLLGAGRWTVTVPEGWEWFFDILWSDLGTLGTYLDPGGPGEVAFGWWDVANVFTDPCDWKDSVADPPVGPTVDDLATAFAEQVGRAGVMTDVTFGGYPAKRIELSVPADFDVATCDEGVYHEFLSPGEALPPAVKAVDPAKPHMAGRTDVLYILDLDGTRWMMRTWHHPESSPEDLAEMEAMLASIRIDAPAPSPAASASPGSQA